MGSVTFGAAIAELLLPIVDTGAEAAGPFGEVGAFTLVDEELGKNDWFDTPEGAALFGDIPVRDAGVVAGVIVLAAAFEPAEDVAED